MLVQHWGTIMFTVWAIGVAALVTMRLRLWLRIRNLVRVSVPIQAVGVVIPARVRVRSSAAILEPSVVGVLRPILLLPSDIESFVSPHQFRAVVAHELCHARHRDNLTATLHMAVEAIFWFYPLVWWLGARLVEARERACDADAVREVDDPQVYAEGLLNVCKRYVHGSVACVSGIGGADLKLRIDAIMTNRTDVALTASMKSALLFAVVFAFTFPVIVGAVSSVSDSAQGVAVATQRPLFSTPSLADLPSMAGEELRRIPRLRPVDEQEGSLGDSGVTAPRLTHKELTRYPQAAKDARIQGTVGLAVLVNADGTVGRVRVRRSLDTKYGLDDAAASAVARWRFEPGRRQGKPIPVEVSLEFTFTLRE
jgi:TonB family protein